MSQLILSNPFMSGIIGTLERALCTYWIIRSLSSSVEWSWFHCSAVSINTRTCSVALTARTSASDSSYCIHYLLMFGVPEQDMLYRIAVKISIATRVHALVFSHTPQCSHAHNNSKFGTPTTVTCLHFLPHPLKRWCGNNLNNNDGYLIVL